MDEKNLVNIRRQTTNQAQAAIPGTWQHTALTEINRKIDRQNEPEGGVGKRRRRHRGPHQECKEDQFRYSSQGGGGINWVSYREQVLKPLLYPWIDKIQALTGMPITYLVERNAPSQETVQRVDREERISRGIVTFK